MAGFSLHSIIVPGHAILLDWHLVKMFWSIRRRDWPSMCHNRLQITNFKIIGWQHFNVVVLLKCFIRDLDEFSIWSRFPMFPCHDCTTLLFWLAQAIDMNKSAKLSIESFDMAALHGVRWRASTRMHNSNPFARFQISLRVISVPPDWLEDVNRSFSDSVHSSPCTN